ncbi:MAG: hypothetical protein V1875_00930 [Candidatus Altiarchaeota archaeon]
MTERLSYGMPVEEIHQRTTMPDAIKLPKPIPKLTDETRQQMERNIAAISDMPRDKYVDRATVPQDWMERIPEEQLILKTSEGVTSLDSYLRQHGRPPKDSTLYKFDEKGRFSELAKGDSLDGNLRQLAAWREPALLASTVSPHGRSQINHSLGYLNETNGKKAVSHLFDIASIEQRAGRNPDHAIESALIRLGNHPDMDVSVLGDILNGAQQTERVEKLSRYVSFRGEQRVGSGSTFTESPQTSKEKKPEDETAPKRPDPDVLEAQVALEEPEPGRNPQPELHTVTRTRPREQRR